MERGTAGWAEVRAMRDSSPLFCAGRVAYGIGVGAGEVWRLEWGVKNSRTGCTEGDELALEAAELLREEVGVAEAIEGRVVGAYGLMRVGEVVTDRGGGRRDEAVVSGEERYRAELGAEDCTDEDGEFGATGEVGEAGPGNGELCNLEVVALPGLALRNLSTSWRNWWHS